MKYSGFKYLAIVLVAYFTLNISGVQAADRVVIIYNMIEGNGMKTDWGFAAWVECGDKVILFDAGTDGEILEKNMRYLNLDPDKINKVVISHKHHDHLGGLKYFKQFLPPNVSVYLPTQLSDQQKAGLDGLNLKVGSEYEEIENGIWITEVMRSPRNRIPEQALVVAKLNSFVLITGCAHPGIIEICENVIEHFPGKKPELVTGGTHLVRTNKTIVKQISTKLKELGFEKVAPSHCTGVESVDIIREDWGTDFLQLFLGDTYPL